MELKGPVIYSSLKMMGHDIHEISCINNPAVFYLFFLSQLQCCNFQLQLQYNLLEPKESYPHLNQPTQLQLQSGKHWNVRRPEKKRLL